jgi:hypothetical protein
MHLLSLFLSLSLSRSPLFPLCARVITDLLDDNDKQDGDQREGKQRARSIIRSLLFARAVMGSKRTQPRENGRYYKSVEE